MSEQLTIPEEIRIPQLKKEIKQIDGLLTDLRHERERVKIGFLNGESARLLSLLTDGIHAFEYFKVKYEDMLTKVRRLKREQRKLRKEQRELTTPKPVPLVEKEPKRAKTKRKKMIKLTTKETPKIGWDDDNDG